MEKNLPKAFIEEFLPKGREAKIFGLPVTNLSVDELITVVGYLGYELGVSRDNHDRAMEMFKLVNR